MPPEVDPQLKRLEDRLRELGSVVVCYSGGVDSAFVLLVAHRVLGDRAVGLTAVSPSLAPAEKALAIRVAKEIGARHELVDTHEIDDPNYAKNPVDRCYYCKSELYDVAEKWAREQGFQAIANGTNTDDLGDYRPGLEAAREAKVVSPLVEVGMSKADVRRHSKALGLGVWDKPASACLSSRLPYGTEVTRERLAQIGGLEEDLRALGFRQLRVRWHEKIARIEIAQDELSRALDPAVRDRIVAAGKKHGFVYVTLDLQGYRTGSHNELLVGNSLRIVS
ncbi:MAG: ATP-dependent sacrificial sulfur transferase LarE [Deltaproteobacteria bacterium]|nr:ATP-dependent sacrificial sulfur transferase LarE [Deltaproteobacteria bacterium]